MEGAYTFFALDKYPSKDAVLVDTSISQTVIDRADKYSHPRSINGHLESHAVVDQVGGVDAIFLFDVLLHQVAPIGTLSSRCTQRIFTSSGSTISNGQVRTPQSGCLIWAKRNTYMGQRTYLSIYVWLG